MMYCDFMLCDLLRIYIARYIATMNEAYCTLSMPQLPIKSMLRGAVYWGSYLQYPKIKLNKSHNDRNDHVKGFHNDR